MLDEESKELSIISKKSSFELQQKSLSEEFIERILKDGKATRDQLFEDALFSQMLPLILSLILTEKQNE